MFSEHVQSRAEQRASTETQVLAAADRLFREQGYEATTVRAIAAAAGVSAGTVMSVGDKARLLIHIFDGRIRTIHEERAAAPAGTWGSVVDEVVALVEPFVSYFTTDLGLAREYASVLVRGTHDSAVFTELALHLVGELAQTLERAGLDAERAARGAGALYYLYLGVLMAASSGALDHDAAVQQFRSSVQFAIDNNGDHA